MSEKAKLSPEKKAEIVRRCLRNEISIGTASQEVCVNKTKYCDGSPNTKPKARQCFCHTEEAVSIAKR